MGDAPEKKSALLDLDDPTDPVASEPPPIAARPTAPPKAAAEELFEEAEFRERMPTLVDDEALEQARVASMGSMPPGARAGSVPSSSTKAKEPEKLKMSEPEPMSVGKDVVAPKSFVQDLPPMRPRAPSVEILAGEETIDDLGGEDQVAILRARLAPLKRVPALARSLAELGALLEDPKTAYVLGFVDGVLPLETIIDVTGLPELDTLRVLDKVASQGLFVYGAKK